MQSSFETSHIVMCSKNPNESVRHTSSQSWCKLSGGCPLFLVVVIYCTETNIERVFHRFCCGESKPMASKRSSVLICAVGSKKQILRVEEHCGSACCVRIVLQLSNFTKCVLAVNCFDIVRQIQEYEEYLEDRLQGYSITSTRLGIPAR